ncbi:NAD(P)-dependent oxidoreductase [Streptomyces rubradiris]|uniref:6-phosphogluconate dehydrogenase n=1 Tax=Streptomyces rubradiris TaxID=285531 RepID=A0ABQ3RK98_STRRR|nr:NAD(P)-dependent oxidoreductase [Streptomyces rubradiris]GHH24383.1 6-phosphogluconate dehydrogenase [Streptomyces rubradiris]GHI56290.1 6-phosphogluconate dehydrogenase [Streptomyces rubradiris]
MTVVGILHPGSMGAAIAAQAKQSGAKVVWCPSGRSSASSERAGKYGLEPVGSLAAMADQADIILSICPPAHAVEVAAAVAAQPFSGVYVDGNAISPATMDRISTLFDQSGATVVDGSVIGSPPSASKSTRLYLAGPREPVAAVASVFSGSAVHVRLLPGPLGQASALKLSYSSYQKASRALAAVAHALAAEHGVEEELDEIAQGRTTSYLAETAYFPKVAARAWRWAPEMEQVARALDEAGLPSELATASAGVMERWGALRDTPMTVPQALAALHTRASSQQAGPETER